MSWLSWLGSAFSSTGSDAGATATDGGGGWDSWIRLGMGALQGYGESRDRQEQSEMDYEEASRLSAQQAQQDRENAAYMASYNARLNDWGIDREKDKKRAGLSNFKQFGNVPGYKPVSTPVPVGTKPPTPSSLEDFLGGK